MKRRYIFLVITLTVNSIIVSAIAETCDLEKNLSTERTISQYNNDWEHYPYNPPDTSISFPVDEGSHGINPSCQKEWWYVNFHLTGIYSGVDYGAFLSFSTNFHNYFFSIIDLNSKRVYSDLKFGKILADKNKLDLTFDSLFIHDSWYTKTKCGELVPFQYKLIVKTRARENKEIIGLNLDMHCLKPPMIVGGDGLVDIGNGWSYYYCQTKIDVSGELTLQGITESVAGYAWIDHQWGNFNLGLPDNRVSWEWFSIKLDDFREIMVADTWWLKNGEYLGPTFGGLNLFNADYSHEILKDYKITQLDFWRDPVSKKIFSVKWRITEPSNQIDLTITADHFDQVIHLNKFIDSFIPLLTWEGSCSVSGVINGTEVKGKAYAESTHSLNNRLIDQNLKIVNHLLQSIFFK